MTNFVNNAPIPNSASNLVLDIFTSPATTVNFPSFTQTPSCGYPITFSGTYSKNSAPAAIAIQAPLSGFITTFDTSKYIIYSTNIPDTGVYTMVLIAEVN